MNSFFDYRISDRPLASMTLTAIHWECYRAIKENQFEEFLRNQLEEEYGQLLLAKSLFDLEALGLITNKACNLKYELWEREEKVVSLSGDMREETSEILLSENQREMGDDEEQPNEEKVEQVGVEAEAAPIICMEEESIEVREKLTPEKSRAVSVEL